MPAVVSLSPSTLFERPYPHLVVPEALPAPLAGSLLTWLRDAGPWQLTRETFYEQYEFSLLDVELPEDLAAVAAPATIDFLRRQMEQFFQTRLRELAEVTAHRLVPGQTIKIHNDFVPGQETHRLLIQLNHGWSESDGGLLLLFEDRHAETVCRAIRPIHRSAFAFAISERSYHAVTTVHAGERFTLVYSFFSQS
jgi:Rps23 Pro-64 3,4-dihydroxylase Tpa1-like proline 4-hydroxylase